uniref:Toxin_TOLIP domain-containing protein n=1 Tax=Steinernema glaseri TaxID=37863 RepID=A0A1I8AVD6_9BILA
MPTLVQIIASVAVVLSLTVAELQCYTGQQRWDPEPAVNDFVLKKCAPEDRCCFMISSMNGTHYGCYRDCPSQSAFSCGPDPKLGIMDIYYCYCNSHQDANCQPYLGTVH